MVIEEDVVPTHFSIGDPAASLEDFRLSICDPHNGRARSPRGKGHLDVRTGHEELIRSRGENQGISEVAHERLIAGIAADFHVEYIVPQLDFLSGMELVQPSGT